MLFQFELPKPKLTNASLRVMVLRKSQIGKDTLVGESHKKLDERTEHNRTVAKYPLTLYVSIFLIANNYEFLYFQNSTKVFDFGTFNIKTFNFNSFIFLASNLLPSYFFKISEAEFAFFNFEFPGKLFKQRSNAGKRRTKNNNLLVLNNKNAKINQPSAKAVFINLVVSR